MRHLIRSIRCSQDVKTQMASKDAGKIWIWVSELLVTSMVFPSFLKFAGSTPARKLQDLNLIPTGTPRDADNFPLNLGVFKGKLMRPLWDASSDQATHNHSLFGLNLDQSSAGKYKPLACVQNCLHFELKQHAEVFVSQFCELNHRNKRLRSLPMDLLLQNP